MAGGTLPKWELVAISDVYIREIARNSGASRCAGCFEGITHMMHDRHGHKREQELTEKERSFDNPGVNSKLRESDVDQQLDKALMDSFPSSDPPSLRAISWT